MKELSAIKIYRDGQCWIAKITLPDANGISEEFASRLSAMDVIHKSSAAMLDWHFGYAGEPMPVSDNSEAYWLRGVVYSAVQDKGWD